MAERTGEHARTGAGARPVHVLAALALLTPVVALFAPLGLVPLSAVGVVALLSFASIRAAMPAAVISPAAVILALAAAWMLASLAWAPDAAGGASLWLSIALISAGGLVLLGAARTVASRDAVVVQWALLAGGGLLLALIAIELAGGGVLIRQTRPGAGPEIFDRGAAVLASFMWLFALAAALRLSAWAGAAVLAAGLVALFLLPMFAAFAAALAALAAAVLTYRWPRPTLRLLAAASVLFIALAPSLPGLFGDPSTYYDADNLVVPESWFHRLYIWQFTAARIGEAPLIGWGLDASRALPGGAETLFRETAVALPLHPHSGPLQVWVELGVPGAILAAALVGSVLLGLAGAGLGRAAAAAGAAAFTAHFAIASFSFGIWQNWWLVVPWLIAALFIAATRGGAARRLEDAAPGG